MKNCGSKLRVIKMRKWVEKKSKWWQHVVIIKKHLTCILNHIVLVTAFISSGLQEGRPTGCQHVEQKGQGEEHQEASSARHLQCVRYV